MSCPLRVGAYLFFARKSLTPATPTTPPPTPNPFCSIKTARLLLRMYDADRSGSLSYYEFERLMGQLTTWKGYFDAHTGGTGRL